MSAHWPNRCTGIITFVRSVMAASTATVSRLNVNGSISTKTGFAPARTIELTVAKKRIRAGDHLIPRLHVESRERQNERVRPGRTPDRVPRVTIAGNLTFKLRDFVAQHEALRLEDLLNRLTHLAPDRVILLNQIDQRYGLGILLGATER